MKRWIACLTLPLTLLFVACDGEPVSPEARAADDGAVDEASADPAPHAGRAGPAERVCGLVACDERQRAEIEGLFAAHRPPKGDARPGPKRDPAARAALADKLRAGALTEADLLAHAEARPHRRPPAELLVGIHGVLSPSQRATLADAMLADGPGLFGGKRGGKRGGKHGGRHGKDRGAGEHDGERDSAEAGKHAKAGKGKLGRPCAIAECTDAQKDSLKAAMAARKDARAAAREAADKDREVAARALADAFRGDRFSAADLERFEAAMKPHHDARARAQAALLVELQGEFTPEQRARLADAVAERGLGELLGDKHGKHGKRGKRGERGDGHHGDKHGRRGGHRDRAASPA